VTVTLLKVGVHQICGDLAMLEVCMVIGETTAHIQTCCIG